VLHEDLSPLLVLVDPMFPPDTLAWVRVERGRREERFDSAFAGDVGEGLSAWVVAMIHRLRPLA
jgi:hypothetical protein